MTNEFSKKTKPFNVDSLNGATKTEVIIESLYFWSDWTDTKKHKIDLAEIIGFNIHFRLRSWHVILTTKEKESEFEYRKNELSHEVTPKMISQMIADDRIKILKISNDHNSDVFLEFLESVMQWAKELRS